MARGGEGSLRDAADGLSLPSMAARGGEEAGGDGGRRDSASASRPWCVAGDGDGQPEMTGRPEVTGWTEAAVLQGFYPSIAGGEDGGVALVGCSGTGRSTVEHSVGNDASGGGES